MCLWRSRACKIKLNVGAVSHSGIGKVATRGSATTFTTNQQQCRGSLIKRGQIDSGGYDDEPVGVLEKLSAEPDPHRFVILPGLEVAQAGKKPIRDVLTWVQCFNIYIAVVAKKHPDMVPEMLAYMLIVLRAQREYEDPAWRLYDEAFLDKAAATGNRKWSQIDTHIYNQIFTGRGCCALIVILRHMILKNAPLCSLIGRGEWRRPPLVGWRKFLREGREFVGILTTVPVGDKCRFRHICSECAGRHPRVSCRRASAPKKGFTSLAGRPP